MTQEIITYIILLLTFGYAIYKFILFFINSEKSDKSSGCKGCNKTGCAGCPFAWKTYSDSCEIKTK